MLTFAWRNLLTRPLRTALALVGLSIPILGVLGLFSLSGGLRNLVGDTLSSIEGAMVLRENAPTPVLSDLPANLRGKIAALPGVRKVAPAVWKIAPPIEDVGIVSNLTRQALSGLPTKQKLVQSLLDAIVIQGQDISLHKGLRSAVYPRAMLPPEKGGGRFLNDSDKGKNHVVISQKIAEDYPTRDPKTGTKHPKRVGESIRIGNQAFEIVGIYQTGSMFLDVIMIMDIETARRLLGISESQVSSFYVEADDPSKLDAIASEIERSIPTVDARSMSEFQANFGTIMGQLDTFLLMTVSLALVVGVVGIVNTMLMSTTERFAEFGVLRTNGWSRVNVLTLVTAESAYLGLLAGVLGILLTTLGVIAVNPFLPIGLRLSISPSLVALGLGLAVLMGTLGGLYPAWKASRMVPMDAIRLGAR